MYGNTANSSSSCGSLTVVRQFSQRHSAYSFMVLGFCIFLSVTSKMNINKYFSEHRRYELYQTHFTMVLLKEEESSELTYFLMEKGPKKEGEEKESV